MALSPFYYIQQYAPRFGLDPKAVMAYAYGESSGRWNAVGDKGTSFGPFQMHQGGALGSHTPQWAMSPQGILGGLAMMAQTPARGLTGKAAVDAIYRYFGKGAPPFAQMSEQRGLNWLAQGGPGSSAGSQAPSAGGVPAAQGAPTPVSPLGSVSPQGSVLGALLSNLQRTEHGGHPDVLNVVNQFRAAQAAPQTPSPASPAPTATGAAGDSGPALQGYPAMKTGISSRFSNLSFAGHTDWVHVDTTLLSKLNELGRELGTRVRIISGYRSPGYSASVGGYATDPHTRGVAVDAYLGGTPIGDNPRARAILQRLGLESGAQPNFYQGKPDPEHVQIPGSGDNKSIRARHTTR